MGNTSHKHFVAALILSIVVVPRAFSQQDALSQRAALAALRAAPLDSLTSQSCKSIGIDPSIRALHQPTAFVGTTPIAFTLTFSPDSVQAHLPISFRPLGLADSTFSVAQVAMGMFLVDSGSTYAKFIIGVGGCRLAGYIIYIDVSRRDSDLIATVRAIHEG